MSTPHAAGRKTGPKPSFTRQDVIDAALDLGIADFTLSAVARRLNVVTAALYRVFPSRDAVLDACLTQIAATIAPPRAGTSWQDALRLWADECWRICEVTPGLAKTLYSYAPAFTHIEDILRTYTEVVQESGRTVSQAAFALDFLGDTVMACRLGVESMRATDTSGDTGLDQVRERIGDDHVFQPDHTWADQGYMGVKVEFIIDGLKRHWPEV
jgi:AcrR family transcriptional regulator